MIRVAVCGAGGWGRNHVRVFSRLPGADLVLVVDPDEAARRRAQQIAPQAQVSADFADALGPGVDAVVLATPAPTHADLAARALDAGKHVFVEKPLAMTGPDAERVCAAADRAGTVLMAGHLMLYHPAVVRLRELIESGELGEIYYLYALRVNLGVLRRDENALWSLAPHDISILDYLLGAAPVSVSARGGAYLQEGIEDVVFVNLRYETGVVAQVQLSWLDPRKERRLTVVGSKKMVELDDTHPVEKLRIYDKGFERPPQFADYAEYLSIRHGDIHIPRVEMVEPLEVECRHFLECIENGRTPRSDGASALRVVKTLAAAQASLQEDGAPVTL